eukprot:6192947-Pleurochrysis_carterae.AAC.2
MSTAGILEALLIANEGVPLAPQRMFPGADDEGVLVCTTDASGVDGVGGYAFAADLPGVVWLVSEWWPQNVAEMLARGAMTSAERAAEAEVEGDMPTVSMPAAELFGAWAVAAAAAEARGAAPSA